MFDIHTCKHSDMPSPSENTLYIKYSIDVVDGNEHTSLSHMKREDFKYGLYIPFYLSNISGRSHIFNSFKSNFKNIADTTNLFSTEELQYTLEHNLNIMTDFMSLLLSGNGDTNTFYKNRDNTSKYFNVFFEIDPQYNKYLIGSTIMKLLGMERSVRTDCADKLYSKVSWIHVDNDYEGEVPDLFSTEVYNEMTSDENSTDVTIACGSKMPDRIPNFIRDVAEIAKGGDVFSTMHAEYKKADEAGDTEMMETISTAILFSMRAIKDHTTDEVDKQNGFLNERNDEIPCPYAACNEAYRKLYMNPDQKPPTKPILDTDMLPIHALDIIINDSFTYYVDEFKNVSAFYKNKSD